MQYNSLHDELLVYTLDIHYRNLKTHAVNLVKTPYDAQRIIDEDDVQMLSNRLSMDQDGNPENYHFKVGCKLYINLIYELTTI